MEGLTPGFVSWYGEHRFSADVTVVLEHLTLFFRFYPESGGTSAITALKPAEVATKLAALIFNTVHEGLTATYCLMHFVNFLRDTDRWSGDQESLRAVHGILSDVIRRDLNVAPRDMQIPRSVRAPNAG